MMTVSPCDECGSTAVHATFEVTWGARFNEQGVLTDLKPHGPNGLPLHVACANCEAERDHERLAGHDYEVDPGQVWDAIEARNPDLVQGGW